MRRFGTALEPWTRVVIAQVPQGSARADNSANRTGARGPLRASSERTSPVDLKQGSLPKPIKSHEFARTLDASTRLQLQTTNTSRQRHLLNRTPTVKMSDDEFDDDDVFDGLDADGILQSSQAPAQSGHKRTSSVLNGRIGADCELASKRVKVDHDDEAYDEENTAIARRLLKEKFGYDSFRHEQEGAITRILSGKSTLVIFPTGAGKSLCYQVSVLVASS